MRREFLQSASWTLKIGAALFWLSVASVVFYVDVPNLRASAPPQYRDAPADWGTTAYYQQVWWRIAKVTLMMLLVAIPNRLLVSSRIAFGISLLVALIPFHVLFHSFQYFESSGIEVFLFSCIFFLLKLVVLGALPVSMILSFLRFQRGEVVTYA